MRAAMRGMFSIRIAGVVLVSLTGCSTSPNKGTSGTSATDAGPTTLALFAPCVPDGDGGTTCVSGEACTALPCPTGTACQTVWPGSSPICVASCAADGSCNVPGSTITFACTSAPPANGAFCVESCASSNDGVSQCINHVQTPCGLVTPAEESTDCDACGCPSGKLCMGGVCVLPNVPIQPGQPCTPSDDCEVGVCLATKVCPVPWGAGPCTDADCNGVCIGGGFCQQTGCFRDSDCATGGSASGSSGESCFAYTCTSECAWEGEGIGTCSGLLPVCDTGYCRPPSCTTSADCKPPYTTCDTTIYVCH